MEKQTLLNTDSDKIYFKGHRLSDIMKTVPVWAIHRIEEFLGKDFIFSTVKDSESFLPRLDADKALIPAKNDQKGDVTVYDCLGNSRVVSKHVNFIINMYNNQGLDLVFAENDYIENAKLEKNSGLNKDKDYCIVNTFGEDDETFNIYTGFSSMLGRGLLCRYTDQSLFVIDKSTSKEKSIIYKGFHYSSFKLNENKSFYIDFLQSKFGMDSLTTDDCKNKEKINSLVNDSLSRVKDKFYYFWDDLVENSLKLPFHIFYNKEENKLIVYCGHGEKPNVEIPIPKYIDEAQFLKELGVVETKLETLFGDWLFRKGDKDTIPIKLRTRLHQFCAKDVAEYSKYINQPFSITFSPNRNCAAISTHSGGRTRVYFGNIVNFEKSFAEAVLNATNKRSDAYCEIRNLHILEKIDQYMMFGYEWIDEFQFKSPFGDVLAPPENAVETDWIFHDHESYKQKINEVLEKMEHAAEYCEYDEDIETTMPSTFLNMCFDLGIEKTLIHSEFNKMEDIFSQFVFDTYTNTISFYNPEACEKLFECTAQELYNKEILAEKMRKFLVSYKEQYDTKTGIAKCIMKLIPDDFKDNVITNKIEWNEKFSRVEDIGYIFVSNEEILFNNFYWNQDETENIISDFDIDDYGDFSEIEEASANIFALLGATTKPLNVNIGKLTEVIRSDAEIVAKRIAAEKIITLVQKLMTSLLHKTKKLSKTDVEKFFNSVYGKAVVGVSASFVLKSFNNKFESKYSSALEELSEELRVSSETEIASELVEKLAGMFSSGLSTESNSMESLVRIVSEATESSSFNQEDVSDYAVSNIGMRAVAANN